MASRKAKSRHLHQSIAQSDYESDVINPIEPAPPLRSNEELNLAVLQSHYPEITTILSIASVAVLYQWHAESSQWEKNGIEGTMFVVQLSPDTRPESLGALRYAVVMLNRRGLENFYTPLERGDDVEITDEYVILNTEQQIYGLWIYAEKDSAVTQRTINASVIKDSANAAEASAAAIAAMLTKPGPRSIPLSQLFGTQAKGTPPSNGPPASQVPPPAHPPQSNIPSSVEQLFANAAPTAPPAPASVPSSVSQLFNSAPAQDGMFPVSEETMFFRQGPSPLPPAKQPAKQPVVSQPPNQADILGDLFRKARAQ